MVYYHGNQGSFRIYGKDDVKRMGWMSMWGTSPRYYVEKYSDRHIATGLPDVSGYGPEDNPTIVPWGSVEMTIYSYIVPPPSTNTYTGITLGTWTNHYPDTYAIDPKTGTPRGDYSSRTYYGMIETLSGWTGVKKEVRYSDTYQFPNGSSPMGNSLPTNKWIGIKFICRAFSSINKVELDVYIDQTDAGKDSGTNNGGIWTLVASNVDYDGWSCVVNGVETPAPLNAALSTLQDVAGTPGSFWWGKVIKPGYHSLTHRNILRNDDVKEEGQYYKWFSIREINDTT